MTAREFVVKSLPAVRMAERSATVATQPEVGPLVGPLFDEVADALMAAGAQRVLGVAYYVTTDDAIQCHAGFEYAGEAADGFEIGELPAETDAVALVHLGSMSGIGDSWGAVLGWLEESGFIASPGPAASSAWRPPGTTRIPGSPSCSSPSSAVPDLPIPSCQNLTRR